ncbi:MAG: hypothetical protein AB1509_13565, partial [Chloroflexota bacterium]
MIPAFNNLRKSRRDNFPFSQGLLFICLINTYQTVNSRYSPYAKRPEGFRKLCLFSSQTFGTVRNISSLFQSLDDLSNGFYRRQMDA